MVRHIILPFDFYDGLLHHHHVNFRLFLTVEISPKLPVNLLRAGRVFVFEPPPGVKANLLRTFSTIPTNRMNKVGQNMTQLWSRIMIGFHEFWWCTNVLLVVVFSMIIFSHWHASNFRLLMSGHACTSYWLGSILLYKNVWHMYHSAGLRSMSSTSPT